MQSESDSAFDKITQKFGLPDVDLFASRGNFEINLYICCFPDPEGDSVDAFGFNGQRERFLFFFHHLQLFLDSHPKLNLNELMVF